jgi:hypothetical protein
MLTATVVLCLISSAFAAVTLPCSVKILDGFGTNANRAYCRGTLYHNVAQLCCNGEIIAQQFNASGIALLTCCGTSKTTVTIDSTKVCCGDNYVTVDGTKTCCGGSYVTSDVAKQCCDGNYVTLDPLTQTCCGGSAQSLGSISAGDADCCVTGANNLNDGYPVANGYADNTAYPLQYTAGTVYDTNKQVCCPSGLYNKANDTGTAFVHKCCQGSYVSYNQYTQFTCGNDYFGGCNIYEKTDDTYCTSSSCGGTVCGIDNAGGPCGTCGDRAGDSNAYAAQCSALWYNADSASSVVASLTTLFAAVFVVITM